MGIISFIDKGVSNSNQKRKNNQMLDKLTIPENLRSKSAQMTKMRPLIIKETQIWSLSKELPKCLKINIIILYVSKYIDI